MLSSILPQSGKMRSAFYLTALSLLTLLTIGSHAAHAQGQGYNENTLYSFDQDNTRGGSRPAANLIDVNGIFYGTTPTGGTDGSGTVYSFDPRTNTEKVLYTFTGANSDGIIPGAGLTYDSASGKLYGTTEYGGIRYSDYANGTIFSINLNGTGYQSLYSFKASAYADGMVPNGSMIDVNGILYGATSYGGSRDNGGLGYGTIFSFDTTTNTEKVLHIFTGSGANGDGNEGFSAASVIEVGGTLYGTTIQGGTHNYGTLFSLNPVTSTFKLIYNCNGYSPPGENLICGPGAGLTNVNGTLYGTQIGSGPTNDGTIFSLDPNTNTVKTIYNFGSSKGDGRDPFADMIYDSNTGKLYGTTYGGGSTNEGTVFSFDPSTHVETTLYSFGGYSTDGSYPLARLLDINGTLYGTTYAGGTSDDGRGGTIFSLTPVTLTPPVARNDSYAPKYATAYAVKAPGVLGNDSAGGSNRPTATLISSVSHGTLTLNHDGSFTYTPNSGFVGTDTFTYQASNPLYQSNTATVSLVVQAVVPVAHNDTYAPIYSHAYKVNAPGVLANDYAGDTGSLTAKLVSSVSHGTLTLNADGSFLYTPTFEYSGTDSFTYTATNAIGNSNTATVTFTINPVAPIAHNDTYAPKYATAYGVSAPGVLGNDDDGGTTPMTAKLVANVTHGTLTFNSNGSFTYTPSAGFVGTDSFTYQDTTPTGTGNTATVTLNVTAALPVAHNDAYTVAHNKAYAIKAPGVLANDYAGDTGTLTAKLGTTTSHGILTFNADGSFNYTPATGYSGTDTFTYTAKNAIGTSNTATVTLNVQ